MPYIVCMNGNEFITRIKHYAKPRKLTVELVTCKGKGIHTFPVRGAKVRAQGRHDSLRG